MTRRITNRAEARRRAERDGAVLVQVGAVPWDIERLDTVRYRATTSWCWRPAEGYLGDVLTTIGLFDGPGASK
jgi:hypothetical protein